ncbi:TetR family transcriptional regulator [Kribbella orskensis]|uniref:TetR family transcriptional regulator n=1 Tax=Kribbella orskensis TaxID=2512216 RepID=A0ABY2BIE9_9ACTN|nr:MULTISPECIES: TetR/AcrR family transcriptional regulator [Kribbella]TCN39063.1 TetR family transcriptional regulator [Kribbella sp. VKM Ac-2500]TCO21710.1 TetR family transcriptional regulator [Kribbella orskensis]
MATISKETAKRLDPDRLAATALEIADAEGLDAVTIRRLAQLHDVTPMALYRHFSDKNDLLAAIGDRLLADIRLPEPNDDRWDLQLRAVLTAFIDALRPHPKAADLTLYRILVSEAGLAMAERTMELLTSGGFSVDDAAEVGRQSLCSLITLVTTEPGANEDTDPIAREDALRVKRAALAALPPRRYPLISAAADTLICPSSTDRYYSLGMDLVVAGIRGVLADLQEEKK